MASRESTGSSAIWAVRAAWATAIAVGQLVAPCCSHSSRPTGGGVKVTGVICEGGGYQLNHLVTLEDAICPFPIEGATLAIRRDGVPLVRVQTAQDGRFVLPDMPYPEDDRTVLEVTAPGYGSSRSSLRGELGHRSERYVLQYVLPGPRFAYSDLSAVDSSLGPAVSTADPWAAGGRSLRDFLQRGVAQLETRDLDGAPVTMTSLRGHCVLLYFGATWCRNCAEDSRHLADAAASIRRGDFEIIVFLLDDLPPAALAAWLHEKGLTRRAVRVSGGFEDPVAKIFGIDAVPRSIVVDRQGRVVGANALGGGIPAVIATCR